MTSPAPRELSRPRATLALTAGTTHPTQRSCRENSGSNDVRRTNPIGDGRTHRILLSQTVRPALPSANDLNERVNRTMDRSLSTRLTGAVRR